MENLLMLNYYRNPLNQFLFNESVILCCMHSFGLEAEWQTGVNLNELFDRACYLSKLLKKEEYIKQRFTSDNYEYFSYIIESMKARRVLIQKKDADPNLILLRESGESQIVLLRSIVFPMIDSYYVTLIYILTFIKNKGIDMVNFTKNI